MKFLTHHRLLSESQHGFREARSCVTQLLQLSHSWYSCLEKGDSVDVIFLDLFLIITCFISCSVMAFEVSCFPGFMIICQTVHKELLLEVIHQNGFREVSSAVPQGSILGPLLFLLYMNSFPLSVSCSTERFADDSVLYGKITSEDDYFEFQDGTQRRFSLRSFETLFETIWSAFKAL